MQQYSLFQSIILNCSGVSGQPQGPGMGACSALHGSTEAKTIDELN